MKKLILTFVFITALLAASSQDTTLTKRYISDHMLFNGSHVSISVIPFISKKATIDSEIGPYKLGATALRGGEVGIDYHYNLSPFYSVKLGLHGTANVRNLTFFIPKEDFTPANEYDLAEAGGLSQTVDFYLSMPLLFEKRWFTKKNNHWNITAGIKLGYYPDEFGESISYAANSQVNNAVALELEVGNNFKPWVDYLVGGGFSWLLPNNNLLRLNILANISKVQIAQGQYEINVPGKEVSSGNYASNFSYLGLSISYAFTNTNKRILRIYKTATDYR